MSPYLKRKRSSDTILPLRAPKQPRNFYLQAVEAVSYYGVRFIKSAAQMISNPSSSSKSPSTRKARAGRRRSHSPESQRPRAPQQLRAGSTDPKLRYTPQPEEPTSLPQPPLPPPPKSKPTPVLAEKSTEIIDLTESTPEPPRTPLPEALSKRVSLLDLGSEEVVGPPKSFANSTRSWKPICEVERPIASGSTSGSSNSGVSFTFSCNTSSTSATSNTSLPSKPPSPLITDFNAQVPPGIRTPKRNNQTSGSPRRRPFEREHIHARQHKLEVAKARQQLREQAFVKQKKRGYNGSKIDFEGIFRYASEVRQVIPETATVPEFIWEAGYWEEIRKKANDAPLVKPYTPSLDEVDRKIRDKNRYLDELLQPKLPDSLPAEEDEQVSKLLSTRGTIAKCAREQVTDQDIARLRPGQWLNDEIINFYGAMINARSDDKHAKVTRGQVLNSFYLSTFFWEKLVKDGYEKGRLAKWTKKVDIFAKDIVLIPVNHSNRHWTAAAINFKRKRLEAYDSMNMAGLDVIRRLRQYLEQEHMNKKKKPFDWTGWEDFIDRDHPQQENGFDCGVFTCQTLESLSRGEETRIFTQANMPYIRRKMIWEIGSTRIRDDV